MHERAAVRTLLAAVPGLQDASADVLEALVDAVDETDVAGGDRLMVVGGIGRQSFVVASGTATVTVDGQVVARLGPGSVVGELAAPTYEPRSATVVADGPMALLVFGPRALALLPPSRRAPVPSGG